jgi:hypothetical protein
VTPLRTLRLLVSFTYHSDPGRMTWRQFCHAAANAEAFVAWQRGKGPNPATPPAVSPDAESLGL